ncbi:MAG TPA: helicase-related protein [Candidatus Hydrogenedens sp.]|nr:helicase-related protein [Candidatus Hydrogenedens sp.]
MGNFITNGETRSLEERISELVANSDELKFIVGFFYFSGLKELYTSLIKNPGVILKVLVGLNVDILNYQLVEYSDLESQRGSLSNDEILSKFYDSIKKSINTGYFDKQEFYEQVNFFIELIRSNRLIIKKTTKPNHAKLYIFKLQGEQVGRKTLFITGSSNLTRSGLNTQAEFNVEISDYGFEEAEKYFNDLWAESIDITKDNVHKERLIEILEKETLIRKITPFEAYILVLKTYLNTFEKKKNKQSITELLKNNGYTPYQYQLDAIQQSLAIIDKYNGVVLADVVGLGKTVIACAIARELNKRGIVICPPTLMGNPRENDAGWNMYIEQFGLYGWKVRSLGKLDKIQKQIADKRLKEIEVVIIDEAHRFRNEDTQSYEYLKNICRGKIVILITATPFNNKPSDILSLLKLFVIPKKSAITLDSDLNTKFKEFKRYFDDLAYIKKYWDSSDTKKQATAHSKYESIFNNKLSSKNDLIKVESSAKYLAKQIRDILEPVTIRRNRLDLQGNPFYQNEVKNLSKVADPKEWFYKLTPEQSTFYDKIIKEYFVSPDEKGRFKGAIYRPFEYQMQREEIEEGKLDEKKNFELNLQRNLYDFMRRLLVKRFESSFGSFEKSLNNFKNNTKLVKDFIDKTGKYILDRNLLERIYDWDIEEIEKKLKIFVKNINEKEKLKGNEIYKISEFKRKDEFLADINSDLKMFDEILQSLKDLKLLEKDPKTKCLIDELKLQFKKEPKRKVVIFSEYIDTVKYLKPSLEKHFRVITAVEHLSHDTLSKIYKNFDTSYPQKEDNYDILLATDKLSEGFNLNRAGLVINYDIPWNPVRVIQRIGRINRISEKVFNELYIVNFFPTEQGAELVRSRTIASNKMFLIHNILGEDAKIFDIDEEPSPSELYDRIQRNPETMEQESIYTKILRLFTDIKEKYPDLVQALDKYPTRVKTAKKSNEDELLMFIRKGRLYIYNAKYNQQNEPELITFDEELLNKISCKLDEKSLPLSDKFWDVYEKIKNYKRPLARLIPENSLEQQAIYNLKTLINKLPYEYRDFLKTLLEDIKNYGTLPDFTLRRITKLQCGNDKEIESAIKEINQLKKELGENYLEEEISKVKSMDKEIIVAIENQNIRA